MARGLQPCGTRAAYVRHLAYGQKPCEPCTRANRAYEMCRYNGTELSRNIRKLVHVLATAMGEGRRL